MKQLGRQLKFNRMAETEIKLFIGKSLVYMHKGKADIAIVMPVIKAGNLITAMLMCLSMAGCIHRPV